MERPKSSKACNLTAYTLPIRDRTRSEGTGAQEDGQY